MTNGTKIAFIAVATVSCQLFLEMGEVAPATAPADGGGVVDAPSDRASLEATSGSDAACATSAPSPCGDTNSDPHHCGACGHDCLGGACLSGVCAPTSLVDGATDPTEIVVQPTSCGSGTIVWVSDACPQAGTPQIHVSAKDGSKARIIDTKPTCILDLSANEQNVVWAAYTTVDVSSWDGTALGLVATSSSMYSVALVGRYAYWASPYSTAIGRTRIDEVACFNDCTSFDVGSTVADIAGSAGDLFFARAPVVDPIEPGSVQRLLDDGGTFVIATGQDDAREIVTAGEWVYWVSAGAIHRAHVSGGQETPIVQDNANALVTDGRALFWTLGESDGSIKSCDLQGKLVRTLATGQTRPWAIAVDDTAIYWVNRGSSRDASDGQVMKLARD